MIEAFGFNLEQQYGPAMESYQREILGCGSQILCEDPSGNPIELFQPA